MLYVDCCVPVGVFISTVCLSPLCVYLHCVFISTVCLRFLRCVFISTVCLSPLCVYLHCVFVVGNPTGLGVPLPGEAGGADSRRERHRQPHPVREGVPRAGQAHHLALPLQRHPARRQEERVSQAARVARSVVVVNLSVCTRT